jgi:hypothetical protein
MPELSKAGVLTPWASLFVYSAIFLSPIVRTSSVGTWMEC